MLEKTNLTPSKLVSALRVLASDNDEALDLSLNVRQYLDKIIATPPKEFVSGRLSLHSRDDRDATEITGSEHLLSSEEIRLKVLFILARLDGEVHLRDPYN